MVITVAGSYSVDVSVSVRVVVVVTRVVHDLSELTRTMVVVQHAHASHGQPPAGQTTF